MVCQASTGSTATYNAAVFLPDVTTWTALPAGNGVQMVVQDGSTCDGFDFERKFTANFICGASNYSMVVVEQTMCNYVATVVLPTACSQIASTSSSPFFPSSSTGHVRHVRLVQLWDWFHVWLSLPSSSSSSSSSSSLSGGAIAGIVIGSVVGIAIILGVVLAICCGVGGGAFGRSKMCSEYGRDEPRATGSYSQDMEASQSNVEMETHA